MCTLTILPDEAGPRITMNRDEARTRAAEQPPRQWQDPAIIAPVDSAAGGTWIGVRADGAWAAVLNGYASGDIEAPGRCSRGMLVPGLLAGDIFAPRPAGRMEDYASFRLLAGQGKRIVEWFWDRKTLSRAEPVLGQGVVRVSSGWRQDAVRDYREAAFDAWLTGGETGDTPPSFHLWREDGYEAWGVRMARAWSRTRSITMIGPGARMTWWPVDEREGPGPPVVLAAAT